MLAILGGLLIILVAGTYLADDGDSQVAVVGENLTGSHQGSPDTEADTPLSGHIPHRESSKQAETVAVFFGGGTMVTAGTRFAGPSKSRG